MDVIASNHTCKMHVGDSTESHKDTDHGYKFTVDVKNGPIDPDLVRVIQAWPTLPPAIREAILRAAE